MTVRILHLSVPFTPRLFGIKYNAYIQMACNVKHNMKGVFTWERVQYRHRNASRHQTLQAANSPRKADKRHVICNHLVTSPQGSQTPIYPKVSYPGNKRIANIRKYLPTGTCNEEYKYKYLWLQVPVAIYTCKSTGIDSEATGTRDKYLWHTRVFIKKLLRFFSVQLHHTRLAYWWSLYSNFQSMCQFKRRLAKSI